MFQIRQIANYIVIGSNIAKPYFKGLGGEGLQERQAASGEPFNVTPHYPSWYIKIIQSAV